MQQNNNRKKDINERKKFLKCKIWSIEIKHISSQN